MSKTSDQGKKKCGFAVMEKKAIQAIASEGGKSAHASGVAHEWTAEEARIAGRKGAFGRVAKKRGVSLDLYLREAAEKAGVTVEEFLAMAGRRARSAPKGAAVAGLPEPREPPERGE